MAKRALLVGCNYPGTDAELHGCVNDVWNMHKTLVGGFGFSEDDINVLIDTDDRYPQPTGANIRRALADLVSAASPGDTLFFHYSGHGTRVPADADEHDETGYDECIVPCDMNLIHDEEFRALVDKLPRGAKLTIVSDSCHSGGLIDHEKEQIGESYEESAESGGYGGHGSGEANRGYNFEGHEVRNKSLPLDVLLNALRERSGNSDVGVGNIRPTLVGLFGDDAGSTAKRFVRSLLSAREAESGQGGVLELVGSLAASLIEGQLTGGSSSDYPQEDQLLQYGSYEQDHGSAGYGPRRSGGRSADSGVLVSGCQSSQTSADANPGDGGGGGAYGALSNAIQQTIAAASASSSGEPISNRQLVNGVRELLASQGFSQRPGLYCSDANADAPFIC